MISLLFQLMETIRKRKERISTLIDDGEDDIRDEERWKIVVVMIRIQEKNGIWHSVEGGLGKCLSQSLDALDKWFLLLSCL